MGIGATLKDVVQRLVRVREIEPESSGEFPESGIPGRMAKCLSTIDLISLGVGSCMGTGMYVVSGMVAREMAGPGVVLSFLIAAAASLLSGEYIGVNICVGTWRRGIQPRVFLSRYVGQ